MNTVNATVMLDSHQSGTPGLVELLRRYSNSQAILEAAHGENGTFTAAGCATATVTSQVKTVSTLTYKSNGVFKTKAGTDNFWTLTGTTVPAGQFCKWLLMIDAAGAASVIQCGPAASAALCLLPVGTNFGTKACAGVLSITNTTNPFIPGTTLLGATGVTATYQDGFDSALLPWQNALVYGLTPAGSGY